MSILLEIISTRDENLFGSEFRLRVAELYVAVTGTHSASTYQENKT